MIKEEGHSSSSFIDYYNFAPEGGAKPLKIFTFPQKWSILRNGGRSRGTAARLAHPTAIPVPSPTEI